VFGAKVDCVMLLFLLQRNKVVRGDYGSYYCEVKTHSEITCEVSKSVRIELALTNSGPNLEKKSSEQLKQMAGDTFRLSLLLRVYRGW